MPEDRLRPGKGRDSAAQYAPPRLPSSKRTRRSETAGPGRAATLGGWDGQLRFALLTRQQRGSGTPPLTQADADAFEQRDEEHMLDLIAALLPVQAPFAEVLTVVTEETIRVLADAAARAPNHFLSLGRRAGQRLDRDAMALREALERDFLDRATGQTVSDRPVVHDPAVTRIDPVMREAEARRNKMRADREILTSREDGTSLGAPTGPG